MLGDSLQEIAFEKAGIIKPRVPAVVGESHPDTDAVFERKVLYTNLPEPCFMGNRNAVMSLLTFADKAEPALWDKSEEILRDMDLQGEYQRKNLRTVLAALDVLERTAGLSLQDKDSVQDALIRTAARTGFRGRWEKLSDDPYTICDIGHNEHGLKYNFAQLQRLKAEGRCTDLIIVYGSVADKDVDAVLHLLPQDATYIFTQAQGKRALAAEDIRDRYLAFCAEDGRACDRVYCAGTVLEALKTAYGIAASMKEADACVRPLVYIGGSTYVVSEAVAL
jgi:dihydrofolate synthase/folylpolyglutamate synthase